MRRFIGSYPRPATPIWPHADVGLGCNPQPGDVCTGKGMGRQNEGPASGEKLAGPWHCYEHRAEMRSHHKQRPAIQAGYSVTVRSRAASNHPVAARKRWSARSLVSPQRRQHLRADLAKLPQLVCRIRPSSVAWPSRREAEAEWSCRPAPRGDAAAAFRLELRVGLVPGACARQALGQAPCLTPSGYCARPS